MLHAATSEVGLGAALDQLSHAIPLFPACGNSWLQLVESHEL